MLLPALDFDQSFPGYVDAPQLKHAYQLCLADSLLESETADIVTDGDSFLLDLLYHDTVISPPRKMAAVISLRRNVCFKRKIIKISTLKKNQGKTQGKIGMRMPEKNQVYIGQKTPLYDLNVSKGEQYGIISAESCM